MENRLRLGAKLMQKEPLRMTPAGIPVLSFLVAHGSRQTEAGHPRDVTFETQCIALGETAQRMNKVEAGSNMELTGFVAARSRQSRQLIVHVNEFVLK